MKDFVRRFSSSDDWGENTRRFARGIAAAGPFLILARAATAGAQIIAGRWMGPLEFGRVTLAVAASSILSLLLNLGFVGCVVKFTSVQSGETQQAAVISTNLWLQSVWGILCGAALYALWSPLSRSLGLAPALYNWSLAYSVLLALFGFATSALQGVLRFAERGIVEFVYGAAALVLLLIGRLFLPPHFKVFIGAMDVGLVLATVVSFYLLRLWIKPVFSAPAVADILSYTPPIIFYAFSGVVLQASSPLILAAELSAREVGYFGAYSMGSIGIAMVLFQILCTVLVPLASERSRQAGAWKKFFLLLIPLAAALFAALALSTIVMLKLIGKSYPITPEWVMFFAAAGSAHVIFFCEMALLSIRDTRSAWLGSVGSMLMGAVCLIGNLWAIPRFGFVGSAIGLIAGYAAGGAWCAYWGWHGLRGVKTA